MPSITPTELLDFSSGWLHDRCTELPAIGAKGPQVAIRGRTELDPRSLDGVSGLFVFAPVHLARPLPAVKSMWLAPGADINEQAAGAFTGLEYLRLESSQPVNLAWFRHAPLRGIALSDRSLGDWAELVKEGIEVDDRERLRHLAIDCRKLNELPSLADISLEAMTIRSKKRPRQFGAIWRMTSLVALRLYEIRLEDLRAAERLSRLSELHIVAPASFAGIEDLKALRILTVYGRRCPPIRPLVKLPQLTTLELRTQTPPNDLAAIAGCSTVENLALEFGDISSTVDVDFGFVGKMSRLKSLELYGVRMDVRQLAGVGKLKQLNKLVLAGALGGINESNVRSVLRFPSVEITLRDTGKATSDDIDVRRIGQEWTIYRNLAIALKLSTNYEAEAVLRAELVREAPEIIASVEFDSEAGGVSVASRSRKAIDLVVSIIERLIAKTKRPSRASE